MGAAAVTDGVHHAHQQIDCRRRLHADCERTARLGAARTTAGGWQRAKDQLHARRRGLGWEKGRATAGVHGPPSFHGSRRQRHGGRRQSGMRLGGERRAEAFHVVCSRPRRRGLVPSMTTGAWIYLVEWNAGRGRTDFGATCPM